MERLLLTMMKEGALTLSQALIRHYKDLGISDQEMVLLIHIISYQQEGKDFPTVQELKGRMTADEGQIISMMQRLVTKGYLAIDDVVEAGTGVRSEVFQLDPLYAKLAGLLLELQETIAVVEEKPEKGSSDNLYTIFEQEFGRPLSPIECETLTLWQDQDRYPEELIIAALREAVISSKLYFRYIDRILYEWQRNNIRTAKQARDFSLRFRKAQQPLHAQQGKPNQEEKKEPEFPFYNWLENHE